MSEAGFAYFFGGMVLFMPAIYGAFGRSLPAAILAAAFAAAAVPAYLVAGLWMAIIAWAVAWLIAAVIVRSKSRRQDEERRHQEILAAMSGRTDSGPQSPTTSSR